MRRDKEKPIYIADYQPMLDYVHPDSLDVAKCLKIQSTVEIKWVCKNGHEVEDLPPSRVFVSLRDRDSFPCRFCTGRVPYKGNGSLQQIYPDLAAEWHPTLNASPPSEYTPGSKYKAVWICDLCGESFSQSISARTIQGQRHAKCRRLRQSRFEMALVNLLNTAFPTAQFSNGRIAEFEVDCVSDKLKMIIEYDGHYWHQTKEAKRRDSKKNKSLKNLGYKVLRLREAPLPLLGVSSISVELRGKEITEQLSICLRAIHSWLISNKDYSNLRFSGLEELINDPSASTLEAFKIALNESRKPVKTAIANHPILSKEWSSRNVVSQNVVSINTASETFFWSCQANLGHPDYLASPLNRRGRSSKMGSGCPECDRLRKKRDGAEIKYRQDKKRLGAQLAKSRPIRVTTSTAKLFDRILYPSTHFHDLFDGKVGNELLFMTDESRVKLVNRMEQHLLTVLAETSLKGKSFFDTLHTFVRACKLISGKKPKLRYIRIKIWSSYQRNIIEEAAARLRKQFKRRVLVYGSPITMLMLHNDSAQRFLSFIDALISSNDGAPWGNLRIRTLKGIKTSVNSQLSKIT